MLSQLTFPSARDADGLRSAPRRYENCTSAGSTVGSAEPFRCARAGDEERRGRGAGDGAPVGSAHGGILPIPPARLQRRRRSAEQAAVHVRDAESRTSRSPASADPNGGRSRSATTGISRGTFISRITWSSAQRREAALAHQAATGRVDPAPAQLRVEVDADVALGAAETRGGGTARRSRPPRAQRGGRGARAPVRSSGSRTPGPRDTRRSGSVSR